MSVSTLGTVSAETVEDIRAGLTFDRTVPRQLVHRASVTEVFLTDAAEVAADRFLVGAQWPRHHALYRPDASGRCDFMLLAETVRQAGILLLHRFHGVPFGHHFVFKSLDLHVADHAALQVSDVPLDAVLDVRVETQGDPRAGRFDARLEVSVTVDGADCARGVVSVVVVDAHRYELLRRRGGGSGPRRGAAAPEGFTRAPAVAGRQDADVLLRAVPDGDGATWLLHVDPGHPGYFEHPSDHVPGMMLLEAFRQAGVLAAADRCVITALEARFRSFGELFRPVVIRAATRPEGPLRLVATQGETVLAEADALFVRD